MRSNKLEKLTIVIPTFGRQEFISRQIDYWSESSVSLIILDGSTHPWSGKNKIASDSKLIYHHSPVSIQKRLGESLYFVTTEYVVLLSDDEFLLYSALEKCIDFLDKNPDFSCCKGQAIGFKWDGKITYGFEVYPGLKNYVVNSDNGSERMREHMSPYEMATLWSVQRRNVYENCMKAIGSGPAFSSAAASELQVSLISAFMGKVKVLDDLMWLRSFENSNTWGDMSVNEWWGDASYKAEHLRFQESIISYAKDEKYSSNILKNEDVIMAIEAYTNDQEEKNINIQRFFYLKVFFKMMINIFINKENKRNIVIFFKKIKERKNKREKLEALVWRAYKDNYTEILKIVSLINSFHKNKF